MKKLTALIAAAALLLAAVPALAFTGFPTAPEMPVVTENDELFFDAAVIRMENEPTEESTPWGETYNVWTPVEGDPAFAAGDTLTFACEFAVPAELADFNAEELNNIELVCEFSGLSGLELVEGTGLEPNYDCDYDAGFCYPLPGFGNAEVVGNKLVVHAMPSSTVQVILRGAAEGSKVDCTLTETIGAYKLPCYYSVGKVVEEEGCIYVYDKDIYAVQIRGMKFFAEEGLFDHYYVCLNDHDYIRSVDTRAVTYTEVGNEENVITEGPRFEALERGYNDVMNFFGFEDDGAADALAASVFLYGMEPVRANEEFSFGSDEPAPVEPTDEPAPVEPEPTDVPAPIEPPVTGAASIAFIGLAAAAAGFGVLCLRRKNED